MKNNTFLFFIYALLLCSSCTNLDEEIYSNVLREDLFENEQVLKLYSGRAYRTLQEYCTEQSLWTLNLQVADECAVPVNSVGEWSQTRYRELQQHNFVVSNKLIRTGWDFCFNGIAACNRVISETRSSPLNFIGKERVISEVRMLRAFYYFCAMDGWGNIPFVINNDDKSYPPQKNRQFIFNFIISEIDSCMPHLDTVPNINNYGRITFGVAQTLLAKMYLNAETWLGTPMYDKAEEACLQVINTGYYAIENYYKTNFDVYNENSRENIFVIPYDNIYTVSDHNSFIIYMLTLNSVNAEKFNIPATSWDGFICQPDFFASYDTADLRRSATWLYGQQYSHSGVAIDGYVIEPIFDAGKYLAGRSEIEGAKLWKWTYQDDGQLKGGETSMSNDFALFRYADVLYMYAEALLRQGKSVSAATDMADFQKIRLRAGLQPLTSSMTLDDLLLERGHELAWEGWRRQDLIRFGKFNNAWWAKSASSPHTKLFPIPAERLSVNPNLEPNPGY
ncbi:MAG: RagB/SusD family nutrient uptake outer membrane protein [Bacteroidales bacterium]|jgi:hypothetical protein|nr:RagB/SusD family nutrient uptake outer membrane protein [Bacteroidales bacterium]